jgi:hypothetical protein
VIRRILNEWSFGRLQSLENHLMLALIHHEQSSGSIPLRMDFVSATKPAADVIGTVRAGFYFSPA